VVTRNRVAFTLRIGALPETELIVRQLQGSEELSVPFVFAIDFTPASGAPLDLGALLCAEANLAIRRPDRATRWVNGICTRVDQTGVHAGRPAYRAVLAPRLVLAGERRNCRVFQDRTAVEIACEVLREQEIVHRSALQGSYPKREMCIQYRETDLAFLARLLEAEGITYWFEHQEGNHTLVLGDSPSCFVPLPGGEELPYRTEIGDVAEDEHLFDVRRVRAVGPGKSTLRDFAFERPALDVTGSSADGAGEEVYDHPSGSVDPVETKRLSRVRLEELRFGAEVWRAQGNCERLAPGCVFAVTGHPRQDFDVRLVALRVVHRGRQQVGAGNAHQIVDSYQNELLAIEAQRPFRPGQRTRRPLIRGVQTATVVGPAGEELHPDRYGRVKVQFHWDREGKRDETASAWVRTAQAWGGPGFGALFVPRIGQEVVLRFLEGDPDRPIVTGAVYNGQNPPAVALPDDKTQSTLKTDSSPHSGGSNELRFEDAAEGEHVFLHGQRNETIEVVNDKDQIVHRDERLRVEQDRSRTIGGDQELDIALDDASEVHGNQRLDVRGDRSTWVGERVSERVGGRQSVKVGGSRDLMVRLASAETVGAAAALTVGAAYSVNVRSAANETARGPKASQVGGARFEVVGAARQESVGDSCAAAVGGDFASDVTGPVTVVVAKDLTEDSRSTAIAVRESVSWRARVFHLTAEEFELSVGGRLALSVKANGTIQLFGSTATVGGATVAVKGSPLVKAGPAAAARTRAALRKLEKLRGARSRVAIQVVDGSGEPVAGTRIKVQMADGTVRTGRTDVQGRAQIPVSKKGPVQVTLLDVDGAAWKTK
jgi:type VI secretion system secreted protein VgrG